MCAKRSEVPIAVRKLVIKLRNENISMKEIGETVELSKATVQTIIKNVKNTGRFESESRSGRPSKLNRRIRRTIIRQVNAQPRLTARSIANELQETVGITVHPETIRRCLRSEGIHSRIPRKKPLISAVNQTKRLEFAKRYHRIHESDPGFWQRVIFTDESKFNVFGNDSRGKVWRKKNQALKMKNLIPTVKHGGGSVMVWGCMAASGVGKLHFINSTMDRHVYLSILKTSFLSSVIDLGLSENYMFQQDNDPKHTSRLIKEWLLYNVKNQLRTPPQSPDLNPIEHLWDHLKRSLSKRSIGSKADLKTILAEEWQLISKDVTEKLVNSMPTRLSAVIDAKGGPTEY